MPTATAPHARRNPFRRSRTAPAPSLPRPVLWALLLLLPALLVPAADAQSAPEAAAVVIPVTATDDIFEDRVEITWPAAQDTNFVFYRVKRDGQLLSVLSSEETSYEDLDGTPGTTYQYCVAQVNVATGDTIDVGCDNGSRTLNEPTGLTATDDVFEASVLVTWTDQSFVEEGYIISRDGSPLDTLGANVEGYFDFDAVPGVTYQYCVVVLDDEGNTSSSVCDNGSRGFIQAPGGVTATDGEDPGRVLVTWSDATDLELGFIVRRDGTILDTTDVNIEQYADSTAVSGVIHDYCVSAVDTSGTESAQVCDDGNVGVLAAPTDVAATYDLFDDRVEVTWTDPGDTEDGFRVVRIASSPADTVILSTTGPNVVTFTDGDAEPGKEYQYCVRAFTDLGSESQAACDAGRRSLVLAPETVTATDGDYEDLVEITWTSEATSVVLFKILRDGTAFQTVSAGTFVAQDFDTAPGDTHIYSVVAVNAFEDESPATTDSVGFRVLNAPTEVAAGDLANEVHVMVEWKDNSFFETGYNVYRRPAGGSTDTLLGTRLANRTAYLDSTGTPGEAYVYTVTAYDALGESDSGEDEGSREIPAPTEMEASDGDFEDRIRLAWVDNARFETGYKVYRRAAGASDSTLVATLANNVGTWDDTTAEYGATYEYIVEAYDAYGASLPASDEGFTILQPPGAVIASDTYADSVVVTWTDNSDIESGYLVTRGDAVLATLGPDANTFSDDTGTSGTVYDYCIRTIYTGSGGTEYADPVCDTGVRATAVTLGTPVVDVSRTFPVLTQSAGDAFGWSVDIDGDWAAVGVPGDPTNNDIGKVVIYEWNGDVWEETQTLVGVDVPGVFDPEANQYGYAVAMDGDLLAVGAPGTNLVIGPTTYVNYGGVYLYERNFEGVYEDIGSLGTDDFDFNHFGEAVDIEEEGYLIVGAPNADDLGAAWVYLRDTDGTWELEERIDEDYLDTFSLPKGLDIGRNVAVSEGHFLIGIDQADPGVTGAVMNIFVDGIGGARFIGSEQLPSTPASARFGGAIAMDGPLAVIGAWGAETAHLLHRQSNHQWSLGATISTADATDYFARRVALDNGTALVAEDDAVYVFRDTPTGWQETRKFQNFTTDVGLADVAIDDGFLLIGDYEYSSDRGRVFYEQLLEGPTDLTASDRQYRDRIQVKWKDQADNEDGYRVYRDGVLLEELNANVTSFSDFDIEPGRVYEYCVDAFNTFAESGKVCDYGSIPADGSITGRVATRSGTAVEGVTVCLEPSPTRALLFDGTLGAVVDPELEIGDLTEFTIEYWARTTPGDPGTAFSYDDGTETNAVLIRNFKRPRLQMGSSNLQTGNLNFDDDEWHHFAWTWDGSDGSVALYVDGEEELTGTLATGVTVDGGGFAVLGQQRNSDGTFNTNRIFRGLLDEFRIWNVARSREDIAETSGRTLTGEEDGLVLYWPMDEGSGGVAADLTDNANYGFLMDGVGWSADTSPVGLCGFSDTEGNWFINDIRYGDSETYRVVPAFPNRQFEPAFKPISLNTDSPVQNEVAFQDISSFVLDGFVQFMGTDPEGDSYTCPAAEVEILVDGVVRGVTGADGRYSFPVDLGDYTIEARRTGHTFAPASVQRFVDADTYNLNFEDLTENTLSGIAAGGCDLPIGTVEYEVRTESGCLVFEDDTDGAYDHLLPAQEYLVRVTDVTLPGNSPLDRADILQFFENLGPQRVDLDEGDNVLDFIYRAPIVVRITGFDTPPYDDLYLPGNPTLALDPVPLVEQGEAVPLIIEVFEDYGDGGLCPVDSAEVVIFDEILDEADTPSTVPVVAGEAQYTTIGNTPNIFAGRKDSRGNDRSYQKPITAVVDIPGQTPVVQTDWVIVTGHRPRVATFTSVAEETPLMILRDPPGDQSSSFIEEGTTVCTNFTDFFLEEVETGINAKIKGGLRFTKGTPFWSTDTEIAQETENKFRIGFEATQENGVTVCATATERISTSGDGVLFDGRGDLYMGLAMNLVFAKTDVIEFEISGTDGNLLKSVDITVGGDGFETTYLYTEDHIRNVLIPTNQVLADSTGDLQFQSAVENWESHLALNRELKDDAEFIKNRSFSAGATFDYSETSTDTEVFSDSKKVFTNNELALGFLFCESGSGAEFQAVVNLGFTYGWTNSEEDTETRTVGYTLADDDVGDFFSVDVKEDDVYGTPVFEVVSGRSSCPWESWPDPGTGEPRTQPRDGSILAIEPPVALDVPPDEPAVFTLTMTNDSQSEELREYVLLPLQQNNPGGAVLRANGSPFSSGLPFFLDPNKGQEVTLTVDRGPNQYTYDNLAVVMVPPCELANFRDGAPIQRADTTYFNVRYEAPCSDVSLFEPGSDWVFNAQDAIDDANTLTLTLIDFELELSETDSLESVGAEYRRVGKEEWFPIGAEVPRSMIGVFADGRPRSVEIDWDVSLVEDGTYELRAFTRCSGGRAFSESATGRLDRGAPVLLGSPQPADSVLALGESIAVTFNEAIDCASVNGTTVGLVIDNPDSTNEVIDISAVCSGSTIVITPTDPTLPILEGRKLRARVEGIRDRAGNPMEGPGGTTFASWGFTVRQNVFAWSQGTVSRTSEYLDPGLVRGDLVNGSDQTLDYEIYDLPTWLTPDAMAGTVGPGDPVEVAFAIQEDLALGSYQHVVRARGISGPDTLFLSPITVKVTVVCVAPDWELDPASFEHSMTIIADVVIDGAPASSEDLVAAFVGNELRGLASPQPLAGLSDSLTYITVYSDRLSGETIRFQFFDASECLPYPSADRTFAFMADAGLGTPQVPEPLAAALLPPGSPQVVVVEEGWTWISFNRLSTLDMSVNGVLGDLNAGDGDILKTQTGFSQFDEALGWVGSVSVFDNIQGYLIRSSEAGQVVLEGTPVPPTTTAIPVEDGWNWIGYTPDGALDINTALDDLAPINGDVIKGQDGFAQYVKQGSTNQWFGSLQFLEPGRAYKLYLDNASNTQNEFFYPAAPPPAAPSVDRHPPAAIAADVEAAGAGPGWDVNARDFQYNMTVTASLERSGEVDPGDAVAVFAGDELRGVARPVILPHRADPVLFLMVHGHETVERALRVEYYDASTGDVYEVEGSLTFEADRIVGDLDGPHALRVSDRPVGTGGPTFALGASFPNPLRTSAVIRYALPTREHVDVRVFDVTGREVLVLVDEELDAGSYEVTLQGDRLSNGVYFYRMQAGSFVRSQKLLVVK